MRACTIAYAVGLAAALTSLSAQASPITYNVNLSILDGSVTGTITTNGATGTLSQSDITGWDLTLRGGGATFVLNTGNSSVFNYGTNGFYGVQSVDLTADTSNLYFDYSGPDAGYFDFTAVPYAGAHYWCNATQNQTFDCIVGASVVPLTFSDPTSRFDRSVSGNRIIATTATVPTPTPEPAALALLGLGVAALAASRRRR